MQSTDPSGLTPLVRQMMNLALHDLTLTNPGAPASDHMLLQQTVEVDGVASTYHVLAPSMTGLTDQQLVDLFLADQDQPFDDDFEHPCFEALAEMGMDDLPLHDEAVPVEDAFSTENGLLDSPTYSTYTLVVQDDLGRVLGMAEFSVSLDPLARLEGAQALDPEVDDVQATGVQLEVALHALYVRKLFRGRGVGSLLTASIAKMAAAELQSLACQLMPSYVLAEHPFTVFPVVFTDWNSKAGKLAHEMLVDYLQMEVDELACDWTEYPELEALDFEPVTTGV